MAKEKHHTAAVSKQSLLTIDALPCGGFIIMTAECDYRRSVPLAAFSTLDEMLAWLKANVGLPQKTEAS